MNLSRAIIHQEQAWSPQFDRSPTVDECGMSYAAVGYDEEDFGDDVMPPRPAVRRVAGEFDDDDGLADRASALQACLKDLGESC